MVGGPSRRAASTRRAEPARKRVRSLERLLARASLPEPVRKQKEAELATAKAEAQTSKRKQRERLNSKKYHGVKFFERRKLERRIEGLKKMLPTEPAVAQQLRDAEHDLLYVRHFPRNKKYLSLFPKENKDAEPVAKLRRKIRARIIRRLEEGTLGAPTDETGGDDDVVPAGERVADEEAFAQDDFFEGDSGDEVEEPSADNTSSRGPEQRRLQPRTSRGKGGEEPSSDTKRRPDRNAHKSRKRVKSACPAV
mmetsp:Transcript_414/g.1336  ORF Transcript_414/g.1336 Transcript_414/m.1336 type:complete len:252 (+) Transcript_414:55-810(+)